MLEVNGPHCGDRLSIPEKYAGQKGNCRHCQKPITVPPLHFEEVEQPIPQPQSTPEHVEPPPPIATAIATIFLQCPHCDLSFEVPETSAG